MENLESLDISSNVVFSIQEALASDKLKKLRKLYLKNCNISNEDLEKLAPSECIKNLSHLELGENLLTLSAFEIFAKHEFFKCSAFLGLSRITCDEYQKGLSFKGNIKNLNSLVLANSKINDEIIGSLVAVLSFEKLEFLDLENTKISLSFLGDLIQSHLKSLKSLTLSCTEEEGKELYDSLNGNVTENLTIHFVHCVSGKGTTKLRIIVPGSRGRSPDNDYRAQQENDRSFYQDNLSNVINTDESPLTDLGHHSKNAINLPTIVISKDQDISPNDSLRAASQTPRTETDIHLRVRNASQLKNHHPSLNPALTFVNKRTTIKHQFFIDAINDNVKLSEWMQSSCKPFLTNILPAEDTAAFGLSYSVLDVNCLKLFTNENLGSLVEIILFHCKIGDEGAKFLAKNLPPSFTTITIKYCDVTYIGISYLFKRGLSYINASHCSLTSTFDTSTQYNPLPPSSQNVTFPIGSKFIFQDMLMTGGEFKKYFLSGNVNFYGVVQLNLEKTSINADDLFALSQKDVCNLSKLDLTGNGLDDNCAIALKDCSFPSSMELNLGDNNIGNSGLQSLLKANFFEKLAVLRMNNNTFNHRGWTTSRVLTFKTLQYLNLSDNDIGPDGASLIASHHYPQLQKLYLSNAHLGDQGAQYLTQNSFSSLVLASLNSNNIGSQGAISLASAGWQKLDSLILDSNAVGYEGILAFISRNLGALQNLSLGVVPNLSPRCIEWFI
ncbi:UNVERIFIED_CONTAM: hypothetical protein LBW93_04210 [Wolbachia endosymbiont of Nasonia longicornis]